MNAPLPVATDFSGLERFAFALFTQAAGDPQAARLRAAALDPDRLQKHLESPEEVRSSPRAEPRDTPFPIPLAYRLWLAHLLWLEEVLHTLDCRPADVTGVELAGLQALARARARFLSTRY